MPNDVETPDPTPPENPPTLPILPAPCEDDPKNLWALLWRMFRTAMESNRNMARVLIIFGFLVGILYLLEHAR
jgi:hypothetical protein